MVNIDRYNPLRGPFVSSRIFRCTKDPEAKNVRTAALRPYDAQVWSQKSPELQTLLFSPPYLIRSCKQDLQGIVLYIKKTLPLGTCGSHFRQGKQKSSKKAETLGDSKTQSPSFPGWFPSYLSGLCSSISFKEFYPHTV